MDGANLDVVLQNFDKYKRQVLANPQDIWKILPRDEHCTCSLGRINMYSRTKCQNCSLILRLLQYRAYQQAFTLKYGKAQGQKVKILEQVIGSVYMQRDKFAEDRVFFYYQQYPELHQCGYCQQTSIQCYRSDNFTNSILVRWYLQQTLEQARLPFANNLYTAFICGSRGSLLVNAPSYNNFEELKSDLSIDANLIEGIWLQIVTMLTELQKIEFSSGQPDIKNIHYQAEPVAYTYNKMRVIAPVKIGLNSLQYGSVTIDKKHYYGANVDTDVLLRSINFVPNISIENSSFMLNYHMLQFYPVLRHIGFALYGSSIDFYGWIVGLMTHVEVARIVWNTPRLACRWKRMWSPTDLVIINYELRDIHQTHIAVNFYQLLLNKWLKCDVVRDQL